MFTNRPYLFAVSLEPSSVLDLLKIIEAGMTGKPKTVANYAENLAGKLHENGEVKTAARVRKAVQRSTSRGLHLSRFSPAACLPVDSESRLPLADETNGESEAAPVFVDEGVRARIDEFLRFVRGAPQLAEQGLTVRPSMLMYGPPGCGKTALAGQISCQLDLPLVTARFDAIVSSYLGSTSKNLRLLFEHTKERPCVLFLDEIDAVAKLRDDEHELGELKRVVVSLLQNLDALDENVVLLAATNHEHLLDRALWRRFSWVFEVGVPKLPERKTMYEHFLRPFASKQDAAIAARVSDGMTGAQIRRVAEDAKREAILDGFKDVRFEGVLRRIAQVLHAETFESSNSLSHRIRSLRETAPDVYTYRRLASIFDVSVGQVAKLLKKEEEEVSHG